jgi:hypothetical protein
MATKAEHTPINPDLDFRKALMRAWVRGWYEGLDEKGTEDGKHEGAKDIMERFPKIVLACTLHDELVKTCRALLRAYEQLIPGIAHIPCADYMIINDAPLLARAVLAKAEKE